MSRLRGWALYAVLLAIAAALAVAARSAPERDSPIPSIDNATGAGTRALYVYLQEGGSPVARLDRPLTSLPSGVRTVVLAAPTARELTKDEVGALRAFAEQGGTVVVLAPPSVSQTQPALDDWLELSSGPAFKRSTLFDRHSPDPGGVDLEVWQPRGPLRDIDALRVGPGRGIEVGAKDALPVAGTGKAVGLWWVPVGKGEAWVFAGPDAIQNRRIELGGNLRFWQALAARGELAFDEYHHSTEPPPPMSHGLWILIAQLLATFLFFAVARGARLGPPRPERVQRHRSTLEYLDSFAWLTRRARVEPELLRALHQSFRVLLQERLGVPMSVGDDEADRVLVQQCQLPERRYAAVADELERLAASGRVSPRDYARVSLELAQLERVVTGRDPRLGGEGVRAA